MYNKLYLIDEKINNGFLQETNNMIYQTGNIIKKKNIVNDEVILSVELRKGVNIQKIKKIDDGYIGLSSNRLIFMNKTLKVKNDKKMNYAGYHIYKNNFLFSISDYDYSTFTGKYGFYDFIADENIWETDFGGIPSSTDGKNLFRLSLNKIEKLNFLNGEILWVYKIQNDLKGIYPKNIGISNTSVIIGLESIDKLIALDLETGELKWEIKSFPSLDKLDETKKYIYSISSGFVKIDTETGNETDIFIDRDYFNKIGILSQRNNYAVTGDYIITTDHQTGTIGAFNTVTHRFDWIHEEPGISFPGGHPIKYSEPYLFVMDNKHNLHIFEKQ